MGMGNTLSLLGNIGLNVEPHFPWGLLAKPKPDSERQTYHLLFAVIIESSHSWVVVNFISANVAEDVETVNNCVPIQYEGTDDLCSAVAQ
jgi:hypothetical protein